MQRHTFLIRKACVADRDQGRRMWFVQRHTFSREKTCIASMGKGEKADEVQRYTIPRRKTRVATRGKTRRRATVQRYPIFDRKTCIANMNNGRRPCTVQRHTISREKTCVASTEREKKTNRSHTTLHNTIRSSHKATTHHITTISKPDNTTNRQNPIPCLKHHTLQHYTTKSSSPETGGRALLACLRTD